MTPIKKNRFVMDDYMLMNAASAFGNSLTNNANVIMAAQTSKADRQFSREMSDLAYERNIELWKMQNEYNLPANQYARQLEGIRANGLNPNLVYGSSSSVTGAAGSVNPYKFESYHSTAVPRFGNENSIQTLLSTRLLETQVEAQEANNRLLNARADNEEARLPGVSAKSNEAAYRWSYIFNHLNDDYEMSIRSQIARDYWLGVKTEYDADITKNKASISYYEAAMAEWLNTSTVPGTGLTYAQYLNKYKAFLPEAQFENIKKQTLNLASQIAYRAKQGEMLDLKMVYQRYANEFAKYGRAIGGDWANVLLSGIMALLHGGIGGLKEWLGLPSSEDDKPEEPKSPEDRGASVPGNW